METVAAFVRAASVEWRRRFALEASVDGLVTTLRDEFVASTAVGGERYRTGGSEPCPRVAAHRRCPAGARAAARVARHARRAVWLLTAPVHVVVALSAGLGALIALGVEPGGVPTDVLAPGSSTAMIAVTAEEAVDIRQLVYELARIAVQTAYAITPERRGAR
jgi:hypothetical protein